MQTVIHPSSERGKVDIGWLNSHHSFSFGHWYNPEKVHFGALRVLNDDIVKGGGGFGTHPHDNMEIISIPLNGSLAHKDSTGTDGIIKTGDVQIMSAGSGIRHSEFNPSSSDATNFLQIWVIPKLRNIQPRYGQLTFDEKDRVNKWQVVVSPDEKDKALWINQDSIFALTKLDEGKELSYVPKFKNNGVYLFVIDGEIVVDNKNISRRDAIGISETDGFTIKASKTSEVLAIEVPMLH
ncbi:MAG: pirin family protein [Bacteroidetes bacterium]|nr:pirin family protein [Bacteroidota bacterium]